MYPGPLDPIGCLKRTDFGIALQRQRDFVKALKKPPSTARIDFESMPLARG